MKLLRSRARCTWLLVVALFLPGRAHASDGRVGVARFAGENELVVRRVVMKVLGEHGLTLIGAQELESAATSGGVRLGSDKGTVAVASRLHLASVIEGTVSQEDAMGVVRLSVRSGRDGAVAASQTWRVRGGATELAAAIAQNLWSRLGPAFSARAHRRGPVGDDPFVERAAPEPAAVSPPARARMAADSSTRAPAPVPAEASPSSSDETAAASPPSEASPSASPAPARTSAPAPQASPPAVLELAAGPRFFSRHLSYDSDPLSMLREFQTRAWVPAFDLSLTWFPQAVQTLPVYLGATARLDHGFSVDSTTSDEQDFQSPSGEYSGAFVARVPTGGATIEATLGGGLQTFSFVPLMPVMSQPALVPDVSYKYLRLGLGGLFHPGGPLTISFTLGYRYLLGAGAIASDAWFPRLGVYGLDGTLSLSYRVYGRWEVRPDIVLRRYSYRFNTRAGDPRESSGAVDVYWSAGLHAVILFGGGTQ